MITLYAEYVKRKKERATHKIFEYEEYSDR